jgi:hypothetical protein
MREEFLKTLKTVTTLMVITPYKEIPRHKAGAVLSYADNSA